MLANYKDVQVQISMRSSVRSRRLVAGVLLLSTMCLIVACQKRAEIEPWVVYARRYIEADAEMLQRAKQATFLEAFDRRDRAGLLLAKSNAPSLATLDAFLRSTNDLDRKAALVTIMVTKETANELFTTIVSQYRITDDFFTKFYSQQCFRNLSDPQIGTFEDRLAAIFASEDSEVVIIAGMPTLIRLDEAKVKPLLIKYMKTGTAGLRRMANIYINRMGGSVYEEVKSVLEADGAVEALPFLQRTD